MNKCRCKNVEFGSYDNTVVMKMPFSNFDCLGKPKSSLVTIDICIATEIASLWKLGVKTINSCCGHGKICGNVVVADGSISLIKEFGYELDTTEKYANPENTFKLKMGGEIVICSAVKTDDGQIIRGHRHCDCFDAIARKGLQRLLQKDQQGFITSENRYVGRREGLLLQLSAGIKSADKGGYRGQLYSEDLY